ncbi:MAG TPA: hypothetical protein VK679_00140 [Gemmatimonadaceae bacterium]|jgi:hypothetical protein|nr:hypothetical protein [Gemmatimonadaceae bacterium]
MTIAHRGLVCLVLVAATSRASAQLKTTTTADQTASVGVPDGWTLAKGSNGFVYVTGPNDERVNLGVIVVAKNGPAGSGTTGEVAFALPFSATLKEKFTTILQAGAAKQGLPKPEITFASEVPTKLPMCSRLFGSTTAGADSRKFEGVICSLRPDWLGLYKNIVFLLQVPSSRAAQDRPIVERIAASYRVTPDMFKKMLAPYTALPPQQPLPTGLAPYQDPTNSDCFDYNVIRESPPWEVPMHCGGTKPY